MTYASVLPEAFPYRATVSQFSAERIAEVLSRRRQGVPNGSSFAITSDAPAGKRYVWLSEISFQTMINEFSGATVRNIEHVGRQQV